VVPVASNFFVRTAQKPTEILIQKYLVASRIVATEYFTSKSSKLLNSYHQTLNHHHKFHDTGILTYGKSQCFSYLDKHIDKFGYSHARKFSLLIHQHLSGSSDKIQKQPHPHKINHLSSSQLDISSTRKQKPMNIASASQKLILHTQLCMHTPVPSPCVLVK
jgi:hypothetical protein